MTQCKPLHQHRKALWTDWLTHADVSAVLVLTEGLQMTIAQSLANLLLDGQIAQLGHHMIIQSHQ